MANHDERPWRPAAWQVGAVSAEGRIAAFALAALAVNSTFFWNAMPNTLEAFLITAVPLVVAIRVIRGFPASLAAAAATFGAIGLLAARVLSHASRPYSTQLTAALIAAIVLSGSGLAAAIATWVAAVGWSRRATIAIAPPKRDPRRDSMAGAVRRKTR
jgi:hypothetical protein